VPLALVSDIPGSDVLFVDPGSVRDNGAYAVLTGGSVEFRRAPSLSAS
jgi:hypothetical protein